MARAAALVNQFSDPHKRVWKSLFSSFNTSTTFNTAFGLSATWGKNSKLPCWKRKVSPHQTLNLPCTYSFDFKPPTPETWIISIYKLSSLVSYYSGKNTARCPHWNFYSPYQNPHWICLLGLFISPDPTSIQAPDYRQWNLIISKGESLNFDWLPRFNVL